MSGSSAIEYVMVVKDYTDNVEWSTTIKNLNGTSVLLQNVDSDFNTAQSILLQPGHVYCVYVYVNAGCGINGIGECTADAGYWDDPFGYAHVNSISVTF